MAWISTKDRLPPKEGWYQVVKFYKGTEGLTLFKDIPPKKTIEYMRWGSKMKLESNDEDRCVYVKYKCFQSSIQDIEQKEDEILYWYELEPIP